MPASAIDAPTGSPAPVPTDPLPGPGSIVVPGSDPGASPAPGYPRIRLAARRASIGALALATLLTTWGLAEPQTAAATDGSCTGWASRINPPRTIRVLRTQSGRVETVRFRRYVAVVMASGEWPARLHPAALEAGAVATKQYAWYYALKGKHRSGYTSGGRCYDVRDDTMDQLYQPERARPARSQLRAIRTTWALSLRKRGRFFLTGYRQGSSWRCAADANGWKLFERSVQACARKGWSRERIQRVYLSPNMAFVWSPRFGPVLEKPKIRLRRSNELLVPSNAVSWKVASRGSRIRSFRLERRIGRGDWTPIALGSATARRGEAWVSRGRPVRFRVRAIDTKGRRGPWAYSAKRTTALRGEPTVFLSSSAAVAQPSPATSLVFHGRSIALLARTGPEMGRVRIRLNGRRLATVDLWRPTESDRRIVWARNFDDMRRRRITVVSANGTAELGGFLVMR